MWTKTQIYFCPKSTFHRKMFMLLIALSCQTLGIISENSVQNLNLQKNVHDKQFSHRLIFFNGSHLRDNMISRHNQSVKLDIGNLATQEHRVSPVELIICFMK